MILEELATRIMRLEKLFDDEKGGVKYQPTLGVAFLNNIVFPITIPYTASTLPTPTHNITNIVSSSAPSPGEVGIYNASTTGFVTVSSVNITFFTPANSCVYAIVENITNVQTTGDVCFIMWGNDTYFQIL